MPNPFVWFDHRSEDPSAAFAFYEQLFDWTPAAESPPGLTAFADGAQPWSGMTVAEALPSGWLPYVQVSDLNASSQKAVQLGATVTRERTRGPAGDYVVIEDPAGGTMALWESPQAGAESG